MTELIDEPFPSLSLAERDRRWALLRGFMKAQGIDCLLVAGLTNREQFDKYITNDISGGFVVFPREGSPVLLANRSYVVPSHLEAALRGESLWVSDVRLGGSAQLAPIMRELGCETSTIGVVGLDSGIGGDGWIPYRTWSRLTSELPKVTFTDVTTLFCELIAVRSQEELRLVRRAAEIADLACQAMLKITRPGVGENDIYAAVVSTLFRNGANGATSSYVTPLILQTGRDNPAWGPPRWLVNGQPPRKVQEGDMVQAEIFSNYGGLEAQAQMSIAIRPLDPVNQECAELARASYQAGLKALVPGAKFSAVIDAMSRVLRDAKANFFTPLIHTLNPILSSSENGVGMDQLPGISRYKGIQGFPTRGGELVMKPGMVVELEPNVSIGKHKVLVGGTVIVTGGEAEALNTMCQQVHVM